MSTELVTNLPFSIDEHLSRQTRLRTELKNANLDAILVFAQESHFWLTGYDTGGYVFFSMCGNYSRRTSNHSTNPPARSSSGPTN